VSKKSQKPKGLYTGVKVVKNFQHIGELYKNKKLPLDKVETTVYPNMGLVLKDGQQSALAVVKQTELRLIPQDIQMFGIKARNKEQYMAMSLLLDPDIDLITITGRAGSGKTLLAMAFAMEQLKKGKINKVVLCKSFVPVGREIGFLPGDMYSKVRPWLGSFYDNFEVLGVPEYELDKMTSSYEDLNFSKYNNGRIELSPITFIQGRSISNAVIIVDEAQNLDREIVKQVLSRPAENSKIIMVGDPDQIFEKGLDGTNNGLVGAVKAGKKADFIGHIHLLKSERSRLAVWASEEL